MTEQYNVKPIFEFARANGDAKIVDRILVKVLPLMLKNQLQLDAAVIDAAVTIPVSEEIYLAVKKAVAELADKAYEG